MGLSRVLGRSADREYGRMKSISLVPRFRSMVCDECIASGGQVKSGYCSWPNGIAVGRTPTNTCE